MRWHRHSGIFNPADLDVLQRVFNQLCDERRLAKKDREQRETLADELLDLFQNGVTNETKLWQALSKRRSA
jgi:hypothetical protein